VFPTILLLKQVDSTKMSLATAATCSSAAVLRRCCGGGVVAATTAPSLLRRSSPSTAVAAAARAPEPVRRRLLSTIRSGPPAAAASVLANRSVPAPLSNNIGNDLYRHVERHNRHPKQPRCRCYSASTRTTAKKKKNEDDASYVSPFQDFFDRMEEDGPTTLGTTTSSASSSPTPGDGKLLKCGVPESALRFSTTSYGRTMSDPNVHPNEHRVVLKVNASQLPFERQDGIEREILREIVGARLNDDRNELRLMSDQFGSRIENKRHLVGMLDRIVLSCRRLAREIDADGDAKAAA